MIEGEHTDFGMSFHSEVRDAFHESGARVVDAVDCLQLG